MRLGEENHEGDSDEHADRGLLANCPCYEVPLRLVENLAGRRDEVTVVSMHWTNGGRRAFELGVVRLPAVAIDGRLASCCPDAGIVSEALRARAVGR